MSIIPTKFEVDITTHCRVIAFLSDDLSRDLVTLTFDLLTLNSCHAWRVTWPTLPPSLRSWVTIYNGSHWLSLKCVHGHCAFAESRDPWVGGQKTITFSESPTPICLFTIQLLLGYDDDISSTSKVIANFLLKFGKFSLPWQQGSSEQSLTDTI